MEETTADVVEAAQAEALEIARSLAEAGIPVFAAAPCPSGPFAAALVPSGQEANLPPCHRPGHGAGGVEYDLPAGWQKTTPAGSKAWLDAWRPGWALAAVGGWAADFLDEDPRNGGDASAGELAHMGAWPEPCATQATPSGGNHYMISPLRARKVVGLLPGLDYQGGDAAGQGRGFVWIAPTVKRSKIDGAVHAYVWVEKPALHWLTEFVVDPATGSSDPSVDGLRLRLAGHVAKRTERMEKARERSHSAARAFTPAQMDHFLAGADAAVRSAPIGEIEERANAYACALSHFVPSLLSADAAFDRLTAALGETAYDPSHPASGWEAEKFTAVISDVGGRAPGDWHAVAEVERLDTPEQAVAAVTGDEISALLAEMLTMDQLAEGEPPRYMIKNLLSFDSETWLIGGPGSKKSFVAFDMAAHVALGKPWQGMKVNPGLVVFIAAEGAGGFGKRARAWRTRYGAVPADRMRTLPRPVQAAELKDWAVLVAACRRLREALDPALGMFIVVDTQARSTVGLDENSAKEIGVYINAVSLLRKATGACVLSVHHTTKAGDSTRGSSALDGAQDTRLMMKSERGSLEAVLKIDKQKDLEQIEDLNLRFEKVDVGQDADGDRLDSLVVLPADGWRSGLFDKRSAARAAMAETPFALRAAPEEWTFELTSPDAKLQRWLLQALADTAEDRGLTQAEWRGLVDEKLGKSKPTATAWRKAFQKVTSSDPKLSEVVVKIHGADRWTVDRMAIEKEDES